jgi:serine phosphatase RsbU (regulator of sigma subunit)
VHRLFDPASYQFHGGHLPFLLAAAALVVLLGYVAVLRGAPFLRLLFMAVCLCGLSFVAGYALFLAAVHDQDALAVCRLLVGPAPLAGSFVLAFDLALCRQLHNYARLWRVSLAGSAALTVATATTPLVIKEVTTNAVGIHYIAPGPLLVPFCVVLVAEIVAGTVILYRAAKTEPSPLRRRQYRGAIWAFSIGGLAALDGISAYDSRWYPLSWLFIVIAALLALRSVISDDLIHSGSIDRAALLRTLYLAVAATASLLVAAWSTDATTPAMGAVAVAGLFVALRVGFAGASWLIHDQYGASESAAPTLDQYLSQLNDARTIQDVAECTRGFLREAVGVTDVTLSVPSRLDYSWRTAGGATLLEAATPDPRLHSWLLDNPAPISRDLLVGARLGGMRSVLEALFDANGAEVILPLGSRDELVGLLCLGPHTSGRTLGEETMSLLRDVLDRVTAALVYVEMYTESQARVELAKEVELAAALQGAFIPARAIRDHGPMRLSGLYAPATRCGGDWWASQALSADRVLVVIADVTGHGVSAAVVTAAAKGCYDVALQLMGPELTLPRLFEVLNDSVARAGAGRLHMTCFASLFDLREQTITFANAGHRVPYMCRRSDTGAIDLDVLSARGNPLGTAFATSPNVQSRPLKPDDVLIWYTDGIVECSNNEGEQYGDRRFQRTIRKLVRTEAEDVEAIRDGLVRAVASFNGGRPPDDDVTLVVGRFAPGSA